MIDIELRENNRIIVASQAGKVPIRVRTGSPIFHSPLDLLCCALGTCIGKAIQDQCRFEKQSVSQFEEIKIAMTEGLIEVHIKHAHDSSDEFIRAVKRAAKGCPVINTLKVDVEFFFTKGEIPKETLAKKEPKRSCCGG